MAIQSPRDLFLYGLYAMYDVERKLDQMLPILAQDPSMLRPGKPLRSMSRKHASISVTWSSVFKYLVASL